MYIKIVNSTVQQYTRISTSSFDTNRKVHDLSSVFEDHSFIVTSFRFI